MNNRKILSLALVMLLCLLFCPVSPAAAQASINAAYANGTVTVTGRNLSADTEYTVRVVNVYEQKVIAMGHAVADGNGYFTVSVTTGRLDAISRYVVYVNNLNGTLAGSASIADKTEYPEETAPTDSQTITPTPAPKPILNDEGDVEIVASAAGKGIYDINVPKDILDNAINLASQKGSGTVRVKVKDTPDASRVNASLPSVFFLESGSPGIDRIEIDTGIATISVSQGALVNEVDADSKSVQFSVEIVDKSGLPEDVARIVGNKPVYDFSAYVDGRQVSKFEGENPIRITLDYKLEEGEDPHRIVVYYINDKGELEVIRNARYDAESGTVTFTLSHFSKYVPLHADVTFEDIKYAEWAREYIEALAAREIVNGRLDGNFHPDDNITREEFIKMLSGAFNFADENAECSFTDVDKNAWYYKYVAGAEAAGITGGIGDNKFGVGMLITRQDMVVMAYRAAQAAGIEITAKMSVSGFSDFADIAGYAREAVRSMKAAEIIKGLPGNRFAPRGNSTRAEAAKIVYLLMDLKY